MLRDAEKELCQLTLLDAHGFWGRAGRQDLGSNPGPFQVGRHDGFWKETCVGTAMRIDKGTLEAVPAKLERYRSHPDFVLLKIQKNVDVIANLGGAGFENDDASPDPGGEENWDDLFDALDDHRYTGDFGGGGDASPFHPDSGSNPNGSSTGHKHHTAHTNRDRALGFTLPSALHGQMQTRQLASAVVEDVANHLIQCKLQSNRVEVESTVSQEGKCSSSADVLTDTSLMEKWHTLWFVNFRL